MQSHPPAAALLGEAELDDVRARLAELGIEAVEARHAPVGETVPLLLSSPLRARELANGHAEAPPRQLHVVICDGPEQIDAPADLALVRPLDSAVLRLLARRPDGEGVERRLAIRVALGAPVRLRVDEDCRQVLISRISIGGCGLETRAPLRPGTRVSIELPEVLTAPRKLALAGHTLSLGELPEDDEGPRYDVSVGFYPLELADRVTLRALMSRHAVDFRPSSDDARPRARGLRERGLTSSDERRKLPRRAFQRRVIGARAGRAQVLLGLDLSPEGVRVGADPALALGDDWKLALCPGADTPPIALRARVERDDGIAGCFLRFDPYEAATRRRLDALLAALAPLDTD